MGNVSDQFREYAGIDEDGPDPALGLENAGEQESAQKDGDPVDTGDTLGHDEVGASEPVAEGGTTQSETAGAGRESATDNTEESETGDETVTEDSDPDEK